MIDISAWTEQFLQTLRETFAERIWFVGLQGSYARGEAGEQSDIDIVVIMDTLSAADIETYHDMLNLLPYRERICGFLSGKDELLRWEPSDLFQFYYDTKPLVGSLDALRPLLDDAAVDRAIKIGACNLYHGCVHNMLHEKSNEVLKGLFKSASFVIQAIAFRKTGRYVRTQQELFDVLDAEEQGIIEICRHLKQNGAVNLQTMSNALFAFCQKWI